MSRLKLGRSGLRVKNFPVRLADLFRYNKIDVFTDQFSCFQLIDILIDPLYSRWVIIRDHQEGTAAKIRADQFERRISGIADDRVGSHGPRDGKRTRFGYFINGISLDQRIRGPRGF